MEPWAVTAGSKVAAPAWKFVTAATCLVPRSIVNEFSTAMSGTAVKDQGAGLVAVGVVGVVGVMSVVSVAVGVVVGVVGVLYSVASVSMGVVGVVCVWREFIANRFSMARRTFLLPWLCRRGLFDSDALKGIS